MHGSMSAREETRLVGPARAARSRAPPPTLPPPASGPPTFACPHSERRCSASIPATRRVVERDLRSGSSSATSPRSLGSPSEPTSSGPTPRSRAEPRPRSRPRSERPAPGHVRGRDDTSAAKALTAPATTFFSGLIRRRSSGRASSRMPPRDGRHRRSRKHASPAPHRLPHREPLAPARGADAQTAPVRGRLRGTAGGCL